MHKPFLIGLLALLCASCASTPNTTTTSTPNSPNAKAENPAMAIYAHGQGAVDSGDYDEALEQFTRLRKQYPKDKSAPQALLGSGYAHYKLGDSESAVETSNAFIQTYPDHSLVDYAYYLRGLARYNDGLRQLQNRDLTGNTRTTMARKAFESFAELVRRYPNSKYNQDSRIRMEVLHSKLAEHEISAARTALSFNKYKEAIARAEYVIKNYSRSESTPEAYSVMIDAFTAQGDLVNAADVRKALKRKYPDYQHIASNSNSGNEVTRVDPFKLKQKQSSARNSAVEAAKANIPQPRDTQAKSILDAAEESPLQLISPNTADLGDFEINPARDDQETWYLSQPSTGYTLQLLGTNNENALQAYIDTHDIADEAHYFRTNNENGDWFTLTYGNYRSRNEALLALQNLSAELQAPNPWVRPMSDIHNKLK